jgi:flagellar M-ring protein FliF
MQVFLQFLKELGAAKVIAAVIFVLLFLLMGGVYVYKATNQQLVVLFSDLDLDDSNRIIKELDSKNIRYELIAGGSAIKVPQDKVLKLRMSMAEQGVPSKGSIVGYEIFDKGETLSTSSFLQNMNYLRALEGELSRTISSIENIDKARVHLVVPKKELFSRERQEPRASIVIKMRGQDKLSKHEVSSIAHIIATAVPELDIKHISIVDTKGRPLKLGNKNETDAGEIASQGQEYKVAYENRLKNMIEDLIEQSAGVGKVKAYVTAEMNFDRTVTNSETYDPEGSVVRSVQSSQERENNAQSESNTDISVANNLPDAKAEGSGKNSNSTEKIDETTNFEVSKTVKNFISETGTVKRLSIAVLVDGMYKTDQATGTINYSPRTKEELDKYTNLVKSAVGFKTDRDNLEVTNMQFISDLDSLKAEEPMDWLKDELPGMIQTLVVAVVAILVLILVVKPLANKAFEVNKVDIEGSMKRDHLSFITESVENKDKASAIDNLKEAMIDIENVEKEFIAGNATVKVINDIVKNHPQESLTLIRRWLAE